MGSVRAQHAAWKSPECHSERLRANHHSHLEPVLEQIGLHQDTEACTSLSFQEVQHQERLLKWQFMLECSFLHRRWFGGGCFFFSSHKEERGVVQASSREGIPQLCAKARGDVIVCKKTNQSCDRNIPWSFPICTSRRLLQNTETWSICLNLSQMTKPCLWITLIPSCLAPMSSWTCY